MLQRFKSTALADWIERLAPFIVAAISLALGAGLVLAAGIAKSSS